MGKEHSEKDLYEYNDEKSLYKVTPSYNEEQ
jgi:hypothetical protein